MNPIKKYATQKPYICSYRYNNVAHLCALHGCCSILPKTCSAQYKYLYLNVDYTDILIPIRKVVRSINLDSKKIQKECGLSIPQILALTFLSKSENYQCPQLELRKFLELNSSTVTGIVSRLEKKGYMAKLPAKGDKRATQLSLTSSGLETLEKAPPLLQEKLVSKLSNLPSDKLEKIQTGLEILVEALGAQEIDAGPILTVPDPSSTEEL
jgi:DNA-binding MarR family transcriptional regulator